MNWRTAAFTSWRPWSATLGSNVAAQDIALDLSAGQIVYEPVPSDVATNNAAATLRYDSPKGVWLYSTAATPFGGSDARRVGFGAGDRILHQVSASRRVNIGADIGGHGFVFRDMVLEQGGQGGLLEAIPFIQVPAALATFEVGGGWRGETLSYAGAVERRHVFESRVHAAVRAASG